MHTRNVSFLSIVIMIAWVGCEYTTDGVELPYEERLVVYGQFHSWGAEIYFERTLRLEEEWAEHSSRLNDVKAHIKHAHGITEIPLDTASRHLGTYRSQVGFKPGEQLELFAEWHGKKVTAKTRRPLTPQIEAFRVSVDSSVQPPALVCDGEFVPHSGEAYQPNFFVWIGNVGIYYREEHGMKRIEDAERDGKVHLTMNIRILSAFPDSVAFEVNAYDKAYYDYWVSQGDPALSGLPRSSLFSGSFRSNVKGDGVGVVWGTSWNRKVILFN